MPLFMHAAAKRRCYRPSVTEKALARAVSLVLSNMFTNNGRSGWCSGTPPLGEPAAFCVTL